jgi:prepilin-type N-terminal cleavage/methylation domain-containing protein
MTWRGSKAQDGMTLVELMVVVALIAIFLALSAWGLGGPIGEERLRSTARLLVSHLEEAKMLAREKGIDHTVVFNPNNREYQVFRDSNEDGNLDDGETVVRTVQLPEDVTISSNKPFLRFNSRGRAEVTLATITVKSTKSVSEIKVTVNILGRVELK